MLLPNIPCTIFILSIPYDQFIIFHLLILYCLLDSGKIHSVMCVQLVVRNNGGSLLAIFLKKITLKLFYEAAKTGDMVQLVNS